MDGHTRAELEVGADAIDVHVFDITAQMEALLRGVREVQRGILTMRQNTRRNNGADCATSATYLASRLAGMLTDCESLRSAVADAAERAGELLGVAVKTGAQEPKR